MEYAETRHNAGFWFLDALASKLQAPLTSESKFFGMCGKGLIGMNSILFLKPMTFMNLSGQSALAIAQFYKIDPSQILVIHDELDIQPGQIRLKDGGGHGGHNGLRDLHRVFGPNYSRIRLGIGHPGHKSKVHNYVLTKATAEQRNDINDGIGETFTHLDDIVSGKWDQAMNCLHKR